MDDRSNKLLDLQEHLAILTDELKQVESVELFNAMVETRDDISRMRGTFEELVNLLDTNFSEDHLRNSVLVIRAHQSPRVLH